MDVDEEWKGSELMLPDSSLKRGWRKQRDDEFLNADDTKCGLGSCRPPGLQCCGRMGPFTAVYSISGLITAALQVYLASQITALERHFGFSSSVTGFLVSANEIGFLSVTIVFSYVVRKMHIPRLLSVTTILYGVSGLLCVVPFLLTKDQLVPPSSSNTTSVFHTGPLCNKIISVATTWSTNDTEVCEDTKFSYVQDSGMRKTAVAIIGAGMILQGIAKAPRMSAITTYIDDNVPKTKSPMYLGIIFGILICAAALAFGLGGLFSRMFITLEPTIMSPMHPRWLGAWWLGFFIFGVAAIIFAIPIICFPRRMATANDRNIVLSKKRLGISGFLATIVRLVSNPVFFPMVIGNCIMFLSLGGIMAFMPKYMETQFTVPSWQSNMILGALGIVTNCTGTIVGGMITSKFKLKPLTCLKIGVGAVIFSLALQGAMVIVGCPNPVISKGDNTSNSTYGYLTAAPPIAHDEISSLLPL